MSDKLRTHRNITNFAKLIALHKAAISEIEATKSKVTGYDLIAIFALSKHSFAKQFGYLTGSSNKLQDKLDKTIEHFAKQGKDNIVKVLRERKRKPLVDVQHCVFLVNKKSGSVKDYYFRGESDIKNTKFISGRIDGFTVQWQVLTDWYDSTTRENHDQTTGSSREVSDSTSDHESDLEDRSPDDASTTGADERTAVSLIEEVKVAAPPRSDGADIGRDVAAVARFSQRDYLEEAREHQVLGLAGEEYVLKIERDKLVSAGRDDLVEKVVHVSVDEGDVAGYDIRSFDRNGEEIFIEVKTTTEGIETPFFVSANQLNVSIRYPEKYVLYRVFDYDVSKHSGSVYEAKGRLDKNFHLSPQEYRAKR